MPVTTEALVRRMVEWRRHLHRHPELGFAEHATAAFVADRLEEFGIEVARGIGGTGVVGTLRAGSGAKRIGLRADMDALAIEEERSREWRSENDGKMHACGHDGHTSILLGAACALAANPCFDGVVDFIFQPAEEHGRGALRMIEDGLFERFPVKEIFGLHNIPGMALGTFATRPGALMGAEDNFEIVVRGTGGHAARPHLLTDPLVTASALVLAIQTIVSRRIDPAEASVISVTELLTNGLRNAIPSLVTLRGDTRNFSPAVSAQIEQELRQIAIGIATAHGTTIESFSYTREFIATINAEGPTQAAVRAALATFGDNRVEANCDPMMISEDFAQFLAVVPGNFSFVGNGVVGAVGGAPLHSSLYDFNDALLPLGSEYFCALVKDRLPVRSPELTA